MYHLTKWPSCNNCCNGDATVCTLCAVELCVTVSSLYWVLRNSAFMVNLLLATVNLGLYVNKVPDIFV